MEKCWIRVVEWNIKTHPNTKPGDVWEVYNRPEGTFYWANPKGARADPSTRAPYNFPKPGKTSLEHLVVEEISEQDYLDTKAGITEPELVQEKIQHAPVGNYGDVW